MRRTLLALALSLAVTAPTAWAHDHADIDKVNGHITAESGQTYGNLSTVNGGIDLERGARADDVDTVNGGIETEDDVEVASLSTVNGSIQTGRHLRTRGDVETVNGSIHIGFKSALGGELTTVNGSIVFQQSELAGSIHTVNGDITVGAESVVHGGIVVEKPKGMGWNWGTRKPKVPRIVIGPNATVMGELRFEREVELYVHASAKVGKIVGATAKPYTDRLPERD